MTNLWTGLTVASAIAGVVAFSLMDHSYRDVAVPEPMFSSTNRVIASEPNQPTSPILQGSDEPHTWTSFEAMHDRYTQAFVDSEFFGMNRIMTFDEPQYRSLMVNNVPYRVDSMELISVLQNEPVAYANSWTNVTRKRIDIYQQRELTEFERASILNLELGEPHTWLPPEAPPITNDFASLDTLEPNQGLSQPNDAEQQDSATLQHQSVPATGTLVAALKADRSCTQCHDVTEGSLLGAFVYHMRPLPNLANIATMLPEQETLANQTTHP